MAQECVGPAEVRKAKKASPVTGSICVSSKGMTCRCCWQHRAGTDYGDEDRGDVDRVSIRPRKKYYDHSATRPEPRQK